MPKVNFKKLVCVIVAFFVVCLFSASAFAKDINPNHKGRAIIHTESVDTSKQLNGVTVNFYQIALLDESLNFVPVSSEIDLSATGKQILNKVKKLNISPQTLISENGIATFENLNLGIYLVEIPNQKIDKNTYGAEAFVINMPISYADDYSYLVEATPKISIQKDDTDVKPVPYTSSQSYLDAWILLAIGFIMIFVGVGIKKHGRRHAK